MSRKRRGQEEADVDRLYKELQIHQVELEEQNRELRDIQERLEESRDRYADLYDFAPVGYVDLDERGSLRGINLTASSMLGEARALLLGRSLTRFVDPNDRGRLRDHLERCRAAKARVTTELVLRPKGGSPFAAQLQSVAATGREQGPPCFRTTITDLSERKAAEEALRQSEERFRSLVNDTQVGFFIAQEGKIAFMNPEQERLFGKLPASLKLEEISPVHPEDRGNFLALCGQGAPGALSTGPTDIRLLPAGGRRSPGEIRWVHGRGRRISWGGRAAILVNMLDVTRTRELERGALVQEKLAALGHVAAGISHEIRNPLSGINIYLSSLEQVLLHSGSLEAEEKEQAEECLRRLRSAASKIASVVQRVLAFSRPIPPTFEMANVNQAIEEAVAISRATLRTHRVKLTESLSRDLPRCRVDLRLLEQVILNLITNADQAMSDGRGRMEISSFRDGDRIVIKVSDSGPGVPPHLWIKIFDPYFTTKGDGTGIGLSFSHRVITAHGGELSVRKSDLGGAEFRIVLPVEARESTG